jgi:hypothetical protein
MPVDDIRAALIAYMKKNAIGVPSLANRIQDSASLAISRSTLQRFLYNSRRTRDDIVQIYGRFAATIEK